MPPQVKYSLECHGEPCGEVYLQVYFDPARVSNCDWAQVQELVYNKVFEYYQVAQRPPESGQTSPLLLSSMHSLNPSPSLVATLELETDFLWVLMFRIWVARAYMNLAQSSSFSSPYSYPNSATPRSVSDGQSAI